MPILKDIETTTSTIYDADGREGFGWVRIRPNQPFEYDDGVSTISVTDATTEIRIRDGQLQSTLQLQPTAGASNNPQTFYIVDLDINGTESREYWQINSADADPQEWSAVQRLTGPDSPSGTLQEHLNDTDPHAQYFKRSEATVVGSTSAASDGLGLLARLDKATGDLDPTMVPDLAADTINITDAGGLITATEVEGALQEIASPDWVTNSRMADNSVNTDEIVNNAVTLAKMSDTAQRYIDSGRLWFELSGTDAIQFQANRATGTTTVIPNWLKGVQSSAPTLVDMDSLAGSLNYSYDLRSVYHSGPAADLSTVFKFAGQDVASYPAANDLRMPFGLTTEYALFGYIRVDENVASGQNMQITGSVQLQASSALTGGSVSIVVFEDSSGTLNDVGNDAQAWSSGSTITCSYDITVTGAVPGRSYWLGVKALGQFSSIPTSLQMECPVPRRIAIV